METYWKFNGVSLLETTNLNSKTIYCSFIFTEFNELSSRIAYLSLTWESPPSAHPGRQQGTALSLFMWHQQWEGQERGWHPTEASAAFQHLPLLAVSMLCLQGLTWGLPAWEKMGQRNTTENEVVNPTLQGLGRNVNERNRLEVQMLFTPTKNDIAHFSWDGSSMGLCFICPLWFTHSMDSECKTQTRSHLFPYGKTAARD